MRACARASQRPQDRPHDWEETTMASTHNRRSLLTGAAAGVAAAGIAAPYVRAQSAITLSFMTWGAPAEQEAFNALIAKYRTAKPNVTVRLELVPGAAV